MIWRGMIAGLIFLAVLFIFTFGGYAVRDAIVGDCEALGAFRTGDVVYKCERVMK